MNTHTLLLAAAALLTVTAAHAGQVMCVAKTTANILDAPNAITGTVVKTVTKRDGYVMFNPNDTPTDLALKGWHEVITYTDDPTGPSVEDVNGYVKADAVHCQLGGAH